MSDNLIEEVRNSFSPELAAKSAQFLGESETGLQKAWSAIVPAVVSGIINQANTESGRRHIYSSASNLSQQDFSSGEQLFRTTDGSNTTILQPLFGNQLGSLVNIVSSYAAVKSSSVQTLMNHAASETLARLGRHSSSHHLDESGLTGYLNNQKGPVMNIVPPDLDLSPIFGNVVHEEPIIQHGRGSNASDSTPSHKRPRMSIAHWLIPAILLTLIAVAALYAFRGSYKDHVIMNVNEGDEGKDDHDPNAAIAHGVLDSADVPGPDNSSTLDTNGNSVNPHGQPSTINIGNSGASIQAGATSTEARLIGFLNDPSARVDTAKGNWYELTGISFSGNSNELGATSNAQLQNIVTIAKAYPRVKFAIGAYGNAGDQNAAIQRAEAVNRKLRELGMPAAQLLANAKPTRQINGNNSDAGPVNARIGINVRAK